jgi:hypothetical protein
MDQKVMQKIAERLYEDCFEAHRGAFWWDERRRIAVAFGNDGWGVDVRAKREVETVRCLLAESGGKELGFATAGEEDYSWALVCELPDDLTPGVLEGVLWYAWSLGDDTGPVVLDWSAIVASLEAGRFGSLDAAFAHVQVHVARATLERNGLV